MCGLEGGAVRGVASACKPRAEPCCELRRPEAVGSGVHEQREEEPDGRVDEAGADVAREEDVQSVVDGLGEEVAARAVGRRVREDKVAEQPDQRPDLGSRGQWGEVRGARARVRVAVRWLGGRSGLEQDPEPVDVRWVDEERAQRLDDARDAEEGEAGDREVLDA